MFAFIERMRWKRSGPPQPSNTARWAGGPASTDSPASPLFLLIFLVLAAVCFAFSELALKPNNLAMWATISEHLGIAFVVACVLGATYEYFLHEHRERMFRRLFDEHREKMFEALKVHLLLTPEQVFDLLGEIAIQTDQMPTLYRPAREREYTFANSIGYFNTLLEVRRKDIISVLQKWIDPKTHINLKFLASDFVGMYQLHELAPELRQYARQQMDQLSDENRGWVLNYVWAVARCEQPRYAWLQRLVCDSDDAKIHEWFLFVPRQMPDKALGQIVEKLLEKHGKKVSEENLVGAARALAALERAGVYNGRATLEKFRSLFDAPTVLQRVQDVWKDLGFHAN
jgi:hypothetical protein